MDTHMNTMSQPGQQPSFSDRVRTSKALIPTLAVMAVTVAALGATLVVKNSDAQGGGGRTEPAAQVSKNAKPANHLARREVVASRSLACANCGVVESVVAVQRQGQVNGIGNSGIGVGAVGGAVVGGLLGNQMGGGNGKTALTVLGAAGGAYAGHAIEKNANKYTAYQMHVRMADGSVRTIEQRSAVAAGSQVMVEGNTLRLAPAATSQG